MAFNQPLNLSLFTRRLPVILALVLLSVGGIFLLTRADRQARDTIRKHHLQDIEDSLYLAYSTHGEYPPYGVSSWCGRLNDPANAEIRAQIETSLRQKIEKYANPDKPFPSDPSYAGTNQDYFYWKHSPASFELFSILEADDNNNRTVTACTEADDSTAYDYGINSILREQP